MQFWQKAIIPSADKQGVLINSSKGYNGNKFPVALGRLGSVTVSPWSRSSIAKRVLITTGGGVHDRHCPEE